jgi:glycosyltransferase involved in cell wall biosynthesis
MAKDLSVIISVHNEAKNIAILHDRLTQVLQALPVDYEVIFVDDGSEDETYLRLSELCQKDPAVKVIKLKRNSGQTIGLIGGIKYAKGRIVVTMDGDLQHSPDSIPRLLEKIDKGYDLVNGNKITRDDSWLVRIIPSVIVKKIVTLAFSAECCDINSTFRAYRSDILKDIDAYGEMLRFLPLMAQQQKIRFCEIAIHSGRRAFGKTHFHLRGRFRRVIGDLGLLWRMKTRPMLRTPINMSELIYEVRTNEALAKTC